MRLGRGWLKPGWYKCSGFLHDIYVGILFVLKKIQNKSKMVYIGDFVLMRVLMKKILVIDDSPINLKLVTKALEST